MQRDNFRIPDQMTAFSTPVEAADDARNKAALPITVLIAVKNEAVNISRCLAALQPAQRVVVIDSGSSDGTIALCGEMGAEVVQFTYSGCYPKKRQWALEHLAIHSEWVMFIDADEIVPDALWEEIRRVMADTTRAQAYLVKKGFHFLGRRMRFGGFSHAAVMLLQRGKGRFEKLFQVSGDTLDMEIHERVIVQGRIARLSTPLIHEDFKGLAAYMDRHNRYSTWEAGIRDHYLNTGSYGEESVRPRLWGNTQERRRWIKALIIRLPIEPWLWFAYHYVLRLGFLDGWRGLVAAQIRAHYISDVRAKMYELRLRRHADT